MGGTKYELEVGQGFRIEPGVQTFYEADQEDPWTYLWVGFDGTRAAEYLRGMGLGENRLIYQSSCRERLERAVLEMLRHNTYTAADQFVLEGLLYSFFGALSEELDVMSAREAEKGSLYVRKAVEFIQDNFCNPIHITDIADYVCINRSYLYTLFRGNSQYRRKSIWRITALPGRLSFCIHCSPGKASSRAAPDS